MIFQYQVCLFSVAHKVFLNKKKPHTRPLYISGSLLNVCFTFIGELFLISKCQINADAVSKHIKYISLTILSFFVLFCRGDLSCHLARTCLLANPESTVLKNVREHVCLIPCSGRYLKNNRLDYCTNYTCLVKGKTCAHVQCV